MLQLDGKITNITIFLTKYLDIMQQYNTVSENGEKHVFKLAVLSDQQSKTENILIFQWYNSKNKSRESSTNQTSINMQDKYWQNTRNILQSTTNSPAERFLC